MPIGTLLVLGAIAISSPQVAPDPPLRTEFCTLVKNPGDFNGKTVVVRARLTELKSDEWGLDSHCFQPLLLALPANVVPTALFTADFVGRFDLSVGPSSGERRTQATFGRSQLRMRFVLREVANPERIVLPRK